MKKSYTDLFDIPKPVPKGFLKYYDKCYKSSHNGREGFVLFGCMQEIWVPEDRMTLYSIWVLVSLPNGKQGGFTINHSKWWWLKLLTKRPKRVILTLWKLLKENVQSVGRI